MWEHASPTVLERAVSTSGSSLALSVGRSAGVPLTLGGEMESREECLREATECGRLAQLANTQGTRTLLAVAAFQWRKLAEKAVERQKTHWPWLPETTRPN